MNAARMRPELEVVLLEKTNKLLSKVKISGGGRCNVTHACFDIGEMSKRYPRGQHFVKKTFHQFFTKDTIHWFEERGVKLKTEEDGRMFPVTDSSQTIIDCLMNEAAKHRVNIITGQEVNSITRENNLSPFVIRLSGGKEWQADFVCIACGGYPKSPMFDWLRATGHSIEEPVPSLFTFNTPHHPITQLMGVSVEQARIKIAGTKLEQEGPLLITHWGLSGPAVLRLSAWGARQLAISNWQFSVLINWLPSFTEKELAERFYSLRNEIATRKLESKNPFGIPQRLWEFLLDYTQVKKEIRWADLPAKDQNKLIKNLSACEFTIKGKTTFKEEFVTAGGIQLSEVDSQTMMSKKMPGLYFAGEVLDVDGVTGGFNFQHAWTSGFVAARSISRGEY